MYRKQREQLFGYSCSFIYHIFLLSADASFIPVHRKGFSDAILIKKLVLSEVAEKAGLGLLYDSAYRLLSDSVHCGPKSLEDYIKDTDEAGRIKSLNVIPIDVELNPVFMNAIQVIFFTLDAIFEYFNLDKKKEMEALDHRFQNLVQIENKKYERTT